WEPMSELDQHVYQYLRPWRYLWRFEPSPVGDLERAEVDAYFEDLRDFLGKEFAVPGVMEDPEGARHHAYLLAASGGILKLRKRPQDALVLVELASRLKTDDAVLTNELARIYSGFGRWTEAERLFRRASELDPAEPSHLLNVAKLESHLGRLTEAEATIRSALRNHAGAPEPYYQLYELEKKRGRNTAAREALEQAITRTRDEGDRARWRAALGAGEKS
ncbi:MAG: tetratricopeptide repeat protein, partial [Deltaproteobacteria bacterium]|nr:tetratricopeptide repeat protein [Deltaproteobacteria bacterium]